MNTTAILGIDLGGTVYERVTENGRYAFHGAYLAIKHLIEERFGFRYVHIISRVNEEQKKRVVELLRLDGFYELTGMTPINTHFCAERHEKAPIARQLGITHFIDDQPEVLSYMDSVPNKIAFRASASEMLRYRKKIGPFIGVLSWAEVEKLWL